MNELQILKHHEISKETKKNDPQILKEPQTEIMNEPQILTEHQISKETQVIKEQHIVK